MRQLTLTHGPYTLSCFVPDLSAGQVVYLHAPTDDAGLPLDLLEQAGTACVCIRGEDWNHELTPWPAKKLFSRGEDFQGRAADYLSVLTGQLLPLAEARLNLPCPRRILAGISLSGLFALYAVCRTDLFAGLCSISGSLWYDGLPEFLETHPVSPALRRAYFSVGVKEKHSRNPRLSQVETRTRQVAALLAARGVDVRLAVLPGGHYTQGPERLRKGFAFLFPAE